MSCSTLATTVNRLAMLRSKVSTLAASSSTMARVRFGSVSATRVMSRQDPAASAAAMLRFGLATSSLIMAVAMT